MLAAVALQEFATFDSNAQAKTTSSPPSNASRSRLGNTKAVCRKCYIHPEVFNAYLDRSMIAAATQRGAEVAKDLSKLKPEEAAVVALLRRRLAESRPPTRRCAKLRVGPNLGSSARLARCAVRTPRTDRAGPSPKRKAA